MSLAGVLAELFVVTVVVSPAGTLASTIIPDRPSSIDIQLSPQLQILQEVVAGPLVEHGLVLYLDPVLGSQTLDQITNLLAIQGFPFFLVDLGSDGEKWCQEQSLAVLRAEYLIHVVVFVSDPRPFFRSMVNASTRWKPKYLMMFDLSNDMNSKILTAEEFSRPEKIVMFKKNNARNIYFGGQMEMFTFFPFSHRPQIVSLGLWAVATRLSSKDIFVDRFPSFEGYTFLLGTWFYDYPYLHQAFDRPEGVGDGVEVEVLDSLASKLNYTYDLTTEPPDEKWGSFENGSWNGMLGMVHREEKNFTVNYFGFTNKRIEDFDASVSYWMEGFGLALMKPKSLPKWRSVYYPFTVLVWASAAFSFSVVTLAFYLQVSIQLKTFYVVFFSIIN